VRDSPVSKFILTLIFRPKLTKLWLNTRKWCGEWSQIWDHTWKAVKDDYIAMQQHEFTPLRCREITWAVICDAKRFFHTQVHPSELTQPNPQYPVPHLASVLLDIQNMVPVVRGSLPLALMIGLITQSAGGCILSAHFLSCFHVYTK
jgi:hypothetical protein